MVKFFWNRTEYLLKWLFVYFSPVVVEVSPGAVVPRDTLVDVTANEK